MNGTNFAKDLNRFGDKFLPERGGDFFRKVTLAAYQGCITTSPVDTGAFRLSWRVSVNNINLTVSDAVDGQSPNKGAPPSANEFFTSGINAAMGELRTSNNVKAIYISNNLPYAAKLEKGSSEQAKNGIVRVVAQQLKYKLGML